MPRFEKIAADLVPEMLREYAGLPAKAKAVGQGRDRPDLLIQTGPRLLVVEVKASGRAAPVAQAVEQARSYASRLGRNAIPAVVVPFMGRVGAELCERAGVSYFDLSGNANVNAPGLRIHVEGRPNRFTKPGRPGSAFAPKSARIARALLLDAGIWRTQQELSRITRLSAGFVSRIVRRLEDDDLLERDARGAVRPRDPGLLLDAWYEAYDFRKHHITTGHIASRSSEQLLHDVAAVFEKQGKTYAATGLCAAWLLAPFATYRLVTLYVVDLPQAAILEEMSFREETRGANLWLVVPNDEGVFHGATVVNGIRCASPVQTFLDLKAMPERAREAAERLRQERMKWRRDEG